MKKDILWSLGWSRKHRAIHESSQAQVARDLGINEPSLYSWISQYRGDVLDNPNTLSPEQELVALKKENAQLKQEREILKKAAAYFARHQA